MRHLHSRFSRTIPLALVCLAAAVTSRRTADPQAAPLSVTVHEGTSMAIALSPDKRTLVLDLQGGLWTLPVAGGEAKRLTDEYYDARQPSWSPDGRRIAFQGYRDGTWHIWTIAPDGTGAKPVTSGMFDDREPHWSPDGATIAFSSDRSGNYDVWILDVASGRLRQATRNPANDFFPTWSPNGREIAFVSARVPAGIYVLDTTSGSERLIAEVSGAVGAPSWRNPSQILFSALPPGGANAPMADTRLILGAQTIRSGEDYSPFRAQWLSDDEFLYPADGKIKRESIGSGSTSVVEFSATLQVAPPSYRRKTRDFDSTAPQQAKGIVHPVMSPDGRQLAFAALGDIWVMPLGGTPAHLTNDAFMDTDPAWSPDGSEIAYSSDRGGSFDVWIRDLKTGRDRQLTTMPNAEVAAEWSPDGKWMAFVSNSDYKQGETWVVPTGGGQPRKILDRAFGVGYPSWSRDSKFVLTSTFKPYSTRYREGMNYYSIVPIDGGTPIPAVPAEHIPIGKRSGDGPALSPNGRYIAYVATDYLYVMPVTPGGTPAGPARQLTTELADSISWAGSDRILYMATDRLKLASVADGSTSDLPVNLPWRRHVPAGRIVVHAGRLIDGRQASARPDMDIIVEGNRIRSVEPHRAALHTGRIVDASGLSVMPGLMEGHGHGYREHGILYGRVHLAYGITTVRSPGAVPYEALEEREAVESGRRIGPRLFTSGYLLDGWRPYYPIAATAPNEAVVDMEVERARRLDYDLLKTYVRLPDLLQKRAIEGAHRIGIPMSSHEIYPAALSGADSVEHTSATSRRGYSPKQSGMGRSYEDVVQIIAQSHMTMTPTIALGAFNVSAAGDPTILSDPRMARLQPAWVQASAGGRGRGAPRGGADPLALQRYMQRPGRFLLDLKRAGVVLIAGVDSPLAVYGAALHSELAGYVEAGLTPFEALQTATVNTAALLNARDDLGTIEAGKLADMVMVEGNPLTNIRDTSRVRTVMKNGEVFTLEELLNVPRD